MDDTITFRPRTHKHGPTGFSLCLIAGLFALACAIGLLLGGCQRAHAQDDLSTYLALMAPAPTPVATPAATPAVVPAPIIIQEVSHADRFQALALGWISAITAVCLALGYAVSRIWPVVLDFKGKLDGLKDRLDRHSDRLNSQDQTIASVALGTPPPASTAAVSTSGK